MGWLTASAEKALLDAWRAISFIGDRANWDNTAITVKRERQILMTGRNRIYGWSGVRDRQAGAAIQCGEESNSYLMTVHAIA